MAVPGVVYHQETVGSAEKAFIHATMSHLTIKVTMKHVNYLKFTQLTKNTF